MNNIILKLEPFAMYVPFLVAMAIPYYFMVKAKSAIPDVHREYYAGHKSNIDSLPDGPESIEIYGSHPWYSKQAVIFLLIVAISPILTYYSLGLLAWTSRQG